MRLYSILGVKQLFLFFLIIPIELLSQNLNSTLNQKFAFDLEKELAATDTIVHYTLKPILQKDISRLNSLEKLAPELQIKKEAGRSFISRKLFFEHLIQLETENIYLTIDPIVYFEFGKEEESDKGSFYKNTRGITANLNIGEKVAIHTSFRENQATLPSYLDERTRQTGVAYGQGRYKTFKEDGFDFAMSSAYISYTPIKNINLQFGHGKHFLGQGHRSLLLSDLSFNYPYLRINSNWFNSKLSYQNIFSSFQSLDRLESGSESEELFERQRGVFHYLEFKPNSKFSIGLFESAISVSKDSSGNVGTPTSYWVPIIFLNSLSNKSSGAYGILGLNTELRMLKKLVFYGQLAINQNFKGDLAYQLGTKFFPLVNWMLLMEYNSQSNFSQLNYSHYNETLSSPVVFNSDELIFRVQFKKERWFPSASIHYQNEVDIVFGDIKASYIVNPSYNLTLDAGMQFRNSNIGQEDISSTYFFVGLRTNLQNLYFNY